MGPSADANDFLENTGVSVPFYAHQDPELRPPADGGLVGSMDIRIPGSMDLRPKKLTLEFSQAETIVEEGNEAPVVDQNSACEPMQIEEEPDSFAQANQAKEPEDAAPEEVSYTADSMDAESDDFAFPPQADGFDAPEETPLEAACLNETVSLTNPSVESLPKNPEVAKAKDVESSTSSVPITSKGKK